jgi:hypothetical protein
MKIVTVSNKIPTQPYYCWAAFHESLRRFGHSAIVLGMNEPWGGLMTKPRRLREWLRHNVEGDIIIVCDSWDVVFAANPFNETYYLKDSHILWNAEKNLFPDPSLNFPPVGTPYRYLNSGFAVGWDHAFLRLLEKMNLDAIPDDHIDGAGNHINPNDQLYFQQAFVNQFVPMTLDTTAAVCQTLHGVLAEELDLTGDRITNRITGKSPMAFHMNGQKELWRDAILQKLNLPR